MNKTDHIDELHKLIDIYEAARQRKEALDKLYKEKKAEIEEVLNTAKARILELMNQHDLKTLSLSNGVRVERVTKLTPRVVDWDAFLRFVDQHKAFDLLQRRVAQRNTLDFMREKDIVPPGIDVLSEYVLRVSKKKGD